MTKLREYSKAIAALLGAIATFLVSVGAPPEWSAYLGSVVAIITGVATFGIPNFPSASLGEKTVTSLQELQAQLDATKQTAQSNLDAVTQTAVDSITTIQQTLGQAVGQVPVVGPLGQQIIDGFKLPGV